MKTIETKVYEYDELPTEKAKEKARAWYNEGAFDYDWYESIYEDAKNIGLKITEFDLDRHRHAKAEFINSAPECAEKIISEHGKNCETYKTAQAYLYELKDLGDRPSDSDENADDSDYEDKREEIDDEFLKSISEDYSVMLQTEYEYLGSQESIEDNIRANEYTFTEDGKRFG